MKIKYKISLYFSLISLLLILSTSILFYHLTRRAILQQVSDHLESVSATKYIRIKDLIRKKFYMIELISNNYLLMKSEYPEKEFPELQQDLISFFQKYDATVPGLREIHILNMQGTIIISSDTSSIGKNLKNEKIFIASSRGEKYIGGITETQTGKLKLSLTAPVIRNDRQTAVIMVDFYASDIVSITSDYTGLGNTGETILVKKSTEPVYLTPLRFDKNAALKRTFTLSDSTKVSLEGFQSKNTSLTPRIDYRGEKVISSLRYFPEAGWIIGTKMDLEEAMQPVEEIKNLLIVSDTFIVIIIILVGLFLGKKIARPIEKLNDSTKKIKEGDYGRRASIESKDEIGILTNSFNAMADELERKISELKSSNESLNKYAYIISHDLKAPLSSIQGLSSIINEEYQDKLDEEGKKIMEMIHIKTEEMGKLISGVLNTAKTGKTSKDKEEVDSGEVVSRVISNLSPPGNVKISVQKNLPVVYYNRFSLYQVFQNLIGNAIKFNDKENPLINISFTRLENKYLFTVEDNGPGIKMEDYSKIFMMFETRDNRTNIDSTGIGLSIVKKIVTEHNGEIWIESELGKGSKFKFTIPE